MTDLEILVSARAMIADVSDWWDGRHVAGERRITNCALSALVALAPAERSLSAATKLAKAMGIASACDIPTYNDTRGHKAVITAYDRAIAFERAEVAVRAIMAEALQATTLAITDAPALVD
ncbi:MAG: hypothetical protein GEU95_01080 [Rhizobiales bacterium]|nr:hypothetical protein [Hyphomicrobiales bacterium]